MNTKICLSIQIVWDSWINSMICWYGWVSTELFVFCMSRGSYDCCFVTQRGPQHLWRNDPPQNQITVVHVIYPKLRLSWGCTSQRSLAGLLPLLSIAARKKDLEWLISFRAALFVIFTSIQTLIRWENE